MRDCSKSGGRPSWRGLLIGLWIGLVLAAAHAETPNPQDAAGSVEPVSQEGGLVVTTLDTLNSFVDLRNAMLHDIKEINKQIGQSKSDVEKQKLKSQLDKLESDLLAVTRNFENIAAGVDMTILRDEETQEFSFQKELLALLKPAVDEMKEMTAHVRQKSDLKETILQFEERLPVLEQALNNVQRLLEQSKDASIIQALKATIAKWQRQQSFMRGELQAARLQLDKLVAAEVSLTEASQSYLKSFFQQRGLYLTVAMLVVLAILLLAHLSHRALLKYAPGFRKTHRSFRVRLVELVHRVITLILVIVGPMAVFYVVEDWVLFSLSLLVLIGVLLTLRHTLPRYLHQIQIFLNIGSVREGERLNLDGLPWQVRQINVFSTLVNPVADLTQRVPIDDLVDLKSRPAQPDEPWFPCRRGDWVILSDGVRGKVIGISPEMVQLVERGGAQLTYQTSAFLAHSPRNLATNFRIKEIIGISYAMQRESTGEIPQMLHDYVLGRAAQEGYGEQLLNLRVEFAQASASSLDLAVIADFKGELGDLYNRLRRAIQRWCVDACSEYGWEIPFPQMTLHGAVTPVDKPPHSASTENSAA